MRRMVSKKRPHTGAASNLCGGSIRRVRTTKRLTQMDLAAHLEIDFGIEIDRSAVGKIERGERKLTDIELVAFAEALGVSVSDLLPDSPLEALVNQMRRS